MHVLPKSKIRYHCTPTGYWRIEPLIDQVEINFHFEKPVPKQIIEETVCEYSGGKIVFSSYSTKDTIIEICIDLSKIELLRKSLAKLDEKMLELKQQSCGALV